MFASDEVFFRIAFKVGLIMIVAFVGAVIRAIRRN